MKTATFSSKMAEYEISLHLIPAKIADDKHNKTQYVTLELPTKRGATASGETIAKYRKSIRTFEDGSPQEFVDVSQAFAEVWRQSSIDLPQDRMNILRMVFLGSAFDTLYTAVAESQGDGQLTNEDVTNGLEELAREVFPTKALENQKRWIEHELKKPWALTTRQTASALQRINLALPIFPDATAADKYDDTKMLEILEWMVPKDWRMAFDKKGYTPSSGDKKKFIEECEILEREQNKRGSK